MGLFPKVESPCPYKDRLDDVMEGDFCSMCERNVFDLTHMNSVERKVFMAGCEGEVCVSYKIPGRKALAGAALALASFPAMATAQDAPEPTADNEDLYCEWDEVIVGGIREAGEALWIDPEAEKHLTDIPEKSDATDNKDEALLQFALMGNEDKDEAEAEVELSASNTVNQE